MIGIVVVSLYLASMPFFFLLLYANGVDLNFRINRRTHKRWDKNSRFIPFHRELFRNCLQLMQRDFLRLHSFHKAVSVRARIKELRRMSRNGKREGKHCGKGGVPRWTHTDLLRSELHDVIARDCFVSRTEFWLKNALLFVFSPVIYPGQFVVVIFFICAYFIISSLGHFLAQLFKRRNRISEV